MMLSEDQDLTLERFLERSRRIAISGLVRGGFKPDHSINFSADSMTIQGSDLDEDHLGALLVLVRPFISKTEPLYIDRIFELLGVIDLPPEIMTRIQKVKDDHVVRLANPSTVQMDGDRTLDNEEMYRLFTNSEYFHEDLGKARYLKSLGDVGQLMGREQYIEHVYFYVWTILELTPILEEILRTEG